MNWRIKAIMYAVFTAVILGIAWSTAPGRVEAQNYKGGKNRSEAALEDINTYVVSIDAKITTLTESIDDLVDALTP